MEQITPQQIRAAFGLSRFPFGKNTAEVFRHPQFDSALQSLSYLAERTGIGTLTAPPGCGKSLLLSTFIDGLSKTAYHPVYIAHTTCSSLDLYRQILHGLGIEPAFRKAEMYRQLQQRLLALSQQKRIRPVLLIDEAHRLSRTFLEEIRLFANFDCDRREEIVIVLAGQPQLAHNLRLAVNEPLAQRIIVQAQLKPFSRRELVEYVAHRLQVAGRSAALFTECGLEALHRASNGIPRVIDQLAERSMIQALQQKANTIDAQLITALAVNAQF